jgi:hypothetical protein
MAAQDFHMSVKCEGDVCVLPTKEEKEKGYRDSVKQFVKFLENKIDQDLGFYFWKRYTSAAFWTQISTPINLIITLMTALTTAQSASNTILPEEAYKQIAIATLVITTLNTFFRPHVQLTYNTEQLGKWNEIGIEFENIYYSHRDIDTVTTKQIEDKIEKYKGIQGKVNAQRKSEGVGTINFITDLIHLIAFGTCIHKYKRWLDRDRHIQRKAELLNQNDRKNTEIVNKLLNRKERLLQQGSLAIGQSRPALQKMEEDFKLQMEAINLHQKAQEEKLKQLELLMFSKSPKCVTNGDTTESIVVTPPRRTRSNSPITPTSIDTTPDLLETNNVKK